MEQVRKSKYWKNWAGLQEKEDNDNEIVVGNLDQMKWKEFIRILGCPVDDSETGDIVLRTCGEKIVFSVLEENDILLLFQREKLVRKLEEISKNYSKHFILYIWSDSSQIRTINLLADLPQVIYCSNAMECISTLNQFSSTLTSDRKESRIQHTELLLDELVSIKSVDQILKTVPGLEENPQERFLLLNAFKSIQSISQKTREEILEHTPCSMSTAQLVSDFFQS